jgi:taurine--2-oxoglutarate transaminase
MAKGLTSGYAPLGVVAMRDEIGEYFNHRKFVGGLTYNGHPICLAAAIANIQVIRELKILEHVRKIAPTLRRQLIDLGENHPSVGEVRSIGLFGILELVRNRETREPLAPYNGTSPEMKDFLNTLIEHGIFLNTHWNTALLIPPLIITEDQLAEGFKEIDKALEITDAAIS